VSTPGNGESPSSLREGAALFLDDFLTTVADGFRHRRAVRLGLWAVAALLTVLTVALLADVALGYASGWRGLFYVGLLVAGLVGVAIGVVYAWRQRPSRLYVARLIERGRPDLKNALITFLELSTASETSTRAALGRRAAHVLSEMSPAAFLPPYHLRRAALATATAALVLASTLWLSQGLLISPWVRGAKAGLSPRPVPTAADGKNGAAPGATPASLAAAGQGGNASTSKAAPTEGAAATSGTAGAGEGATQGSNGSASGTEAAQALASAVRGNQATFDRLAEALDEPGLGDARDDASATDADGASGTSNAPGASGGARGGEGAGHEGGAGSASDRPRGSLSQGTSHASSPSTSSGGVGRNQGGTSSAAANSGREDRDGRSAEGQSREDRRDQNGEGQGPAQGRDASASQAQGQDADPSQGQAQGRGSATDSSGGASADGTAASPSSATAGAGDATPPSGASSRGGMGGEGPTPTSTAADRPPIPERPQSRDFPPEALEALRAARRILDRADERLRDGETSDAFLGEIGMSREEFRRFVVAWNRRFEAAALGPDATPVPSAATTATAPGLEVLAPGAADAARAVRDADPGTADAVDLFADDASTVSPRLQPAVSAYFETLGRLSRPPAPPADRP